MSGPRAPHSLRHEPQSTPLKFEEPYMTDFAVGPSRGRMPDLVTESLFQSIWVTRTHSTLQ